MSGSNPNEDVLADFDLADAGVEAAADTTTETPAEAPAEGDAGAADAADLIDQADANAAEGEGAAAEAELAEGEGQGEGEAAGDDVVVTDDDGATDAAQEGAEGAAAPAEGAGEGEGEGAAAAEGDAKVANPPAEADQGPVLDERAAQQQAAAYQAWDGQLSQLEDLVAKNEYDPFEHGGDAAKLVTQGFKFVRQAIAELHQEQQSFRAEREQAAYWDSFRAANPGIAPQAQRAWSQELAKAEKQFGAGSQAARAVAHERWQGVVRGLRASVTGKAVPVAGGGAGKQTKAPPTARPAARAAAAPAPKPGVAKPGTNKPPVTRGGGRVIPAGVKPAGNVSTKPVGVRDKLANPQKFYGDLSGLVD